LTTDSDFTNTESCKSYSCDTKSCDTKSCDTKSCDTKSCDTKSCSEQSSKSSTSDDCYEKTDECKDKLKSLCDMHELLKTVSALLEKQFVDQLNIANGYPSEQKLYITDVDFNEKILDMFYFQFNNTVKKQCGSIFGGKKVCVDVKCCVKKCKEVKVCILSNIVISIENNKCINIRIGNEKITIKYVNDNDTYGEASEIYRKNIENIEILIKSLHNNQRIISDSINTVKDLLKYNILN